MNCPFFHTPQKQGDALVSDLGEKTQLIINAALDAIIGIDTGGKIILWNPQAEEIFGWKAEEIIGSSLTESIVPHRFREKHEKGFSLYLETGVHTTLNKKLEIYAIDRKGIEFPIELSILPIREGNHEFFCAFIRDISIRRKAETLLVQQKDFSESIINSLPGIFYVFDSSGKFITWNRNLELLSGYTSEEMKQLHPEVFLSAEQRSRGMIYMEEVMQTGSSEMEADLICRDGKKTPIYFSGKRIEIDGQACIMGTGIDISSRVQLQQKLDQKTRQLEKEMTKAVIMAQEKERAQLGLELHDNVNQVLTTVKLYNEMVRDHIGDPEDLVQRSITHLQECINEIRSISKRLSIPTLGKISLADSIQELADSINITGTMSVHCEIEECAQKEISEEKHLALYRITQEQLNNIIKHADAQTVRIRLYRDGSQIVLRICDDGKGFNPVERFQGIGLNNMRSRAENLGGSLLIRSAAGRGCELFVRLPAA